MTEEATFTWLKNTFKERNWQMCGKNLKIKCYMRILFLNISIFFLLWIGEFNISDNFYKIIYWPMFGSKSKIATFQTTFKNPLYGRQGFSWPMRIEAPIPKKILLCKAKFSKKKLFLRGDFTPFISKSFQIWDRFFPLLFPKDSENLKSLDIGLWEMGEKDV